MIKFVMAVFMLVMASSELLAVESKVVVINSGSAAPLITGDDTGFYPAIVKEVFRRISIDARTIILPSARSLRNANQGIEAGVIARIRGIEKKYRNLVMVPEKIIDLDFVAITNNAKIKITSWPDLKSYNVAYIRGWKIFDNKVKQYKRLELAKNPEQLFSMLRKNRVDIILYQNIPGRYWMKKLDYYPHELMPRLDTREMFMYMHKSHSDMVPLIAAELRKMKVDGSYKRIYQKHITDFLK